MNLVHAFPVLLFFSGRNGFISLLELPQGSTTLSLLSHLTSSHLLKQGLGRPVLHPSSEEQAWIGIKCKETQDQIVSLHKKKIRGGILTKSLIPDLKAGCRSGMDGMDRPQNHRVPRLRIPRPLSS